MAGRGYVCARYKWMSGGTERRRLRHARSRRHSRYLPTVQFSRSPSWFHAPARRSSRSRRRSIRASEHHHSTQQHHQTAGGGMHEVPRL